MTGHGDINEKIPELQKVKALSDDQFIPDNEVIYDYLVQKSNELEYEQMIISEILKRLGMWPNQSSTTLKEE